MAYQFTDHHLAMARHHVKHSGVLDHPKVSEDAKHYYIVGILLTHGKGGLLKKEDHDAAFNDPEVREVCRRVLTEARARPPRDDEVAV